MLKRSFLRMSDVKEERRDNMLGGVAIVLIGVLLSASAVWGIANNSFLATNETVLIIFLILGIASIILGAFIFIKNLNQRLLHPTRYFES